MKNYSYCKRSLIVITLLFFQLQVYSQLDTTSLFDMSLEDLLNMEIVSASKKAENINVAPATIYVITEQDIINNGYTELVEALENVPGVVPINLDFFAFGGQRGFLSNFSQTLILINGREMQNLIAAETFISHQFATHNIKRIEIIQGPGSALYGANALLGVINIITKNEDTEFTGLEVQSEIGTEGTKAISLIFAESIGDLRISGSFRGYQTDGWDFSDFINDTVNFSQGMPAVVQNMEKHFHNKASTVPFSTRLDFKDFYVGTEQFRLNTTQGLEKVSLDFLSQSDSRTLELYYGGWRKNFSEKLDVGIELQYYKEKFIGREYIFSEEIFNNLVMEGRDPNAVITNEEANTYFGGSYSQEGSDGSHRYRINAQINYTPNETLTLIGGYTFDKMDLLGVAISSYSLVPFFNETVSEDNRMRLPFFNQTKNSLFFQLQKVFFTDKLYLTLGGRMDYHNMYNEVFTFRGGLVYQPLKSTYIKLLYGQAFREPNIFEQGAFLPEVNKALTPSLISTYEFSFSHSFTSKMRINVVAFKSIATDMIVPENTFNFHNSPDDVNVLGAEAQLFFEFGRLLGDLGYAYVKTDDEEYGGEKVQNLGVYQHRTNLGITGLIVPHLFLNLRMNYYDEIEAKHGNPQVNQVITIPAYTKINTTLTYKDLEYYNVKITASIIVRNLLDGVYYQPNVRTGGPKQFQQPGRQIVARFIFTF